MAALPLLFTPDLTPTMSRPTLLRCAGLALALFGTAFLIAWVGARSEPAPDALASSATTVPILSLTLFAWPVIQGVLSP